MGRPFVRFVPILVLLMSTRPLHADQTATRPLRLADVLDDARQHNPAIRSALERAKAAEAMPPQASAYDDPVLSYEAWNAPGAFEIDRADNNIVRLSQKLPFPGKRTLAGKIAGRDADIARHEADGVALDVMAEVKRAYYALWQAHMALAVYSREKDLVQRFARIAEQKYAVGEVSQSDVLRAQVELTRAINRVTTQSLTIDSARAELNALLSRSPSEPLGTPQTPEVRLDQRPEALTRMALENRPELIAQGAAVSREQERVRLAYRSYLPDFELSVGRFFNPGADNGVGGMVSVSIPIAYKYKYDAAVAEANARLVSAEAELRRLQDMVQREVTQSFLRARTALLLHNLFVSTHIPQAEQEIGRAHV